MKKTSCQPVQSMYMPCCTLPTQLNSAARFGATGLTLWSASAGPYCEASSLVGTLLQASTNVLLSSPRSRNSKSSTTSQTCWISRSVNNLAPQDMTLKAVSSIHEERATSEAMLISLHPQICVTMRLFIALSIFPPLYSIS